MSRSITITHSAASIAFITIAANPVKGMSAITQAALAALVSGTEEARKTMSEIMQANDRNGCWSDEHAMSDLGCVSTLNGMAAVCLSWEIGSDDVDQTALRTLLIAFIAAYHPHGAYQDDEASANGYAPLTMDEIHGQLMDIN